MLLAQKRGRIISWTARYLSLSLITLTAPSFDSRATLECDESIDPEWAVKCHEAIEQVRQATAMGRQIIENLEQSPNTHTVVPTPAKSRTIPVDGTAQEAVSNAYQEGQIDKVGNLTVFEGTGKGTSTQIEWNSDSTDPYPSDGTPRDPASAMMHELWHADVANGGGWSLVKNDDTAVSQDEVTATMVENVHREATDKDLRTKYGDADVPQPVSPN